MRNLSQFFTRQTLSYLLYLPRVFTTVKNPVHFLKSYVGGNLGIKNLELRNGLVYDISNFDDLGVFYEIFIKREYGYIPVGKITIVDIGANNGLFMLYCKSENRSATVHCYEPVPQCARHVQHVAEENHMSNVHVHEAAVSDKTGEQKLFLGSQTVAASLYEDIASGHNAITIKTVTLADIFAENNIGQIDFLKVDCEGGEYDIFYTASKELLDKCKSITIEYHDIDEEKNGKKLYQHLLAVMPHKKVIYHHHPAHPHNGFITVR